jgi:hypothetical protein
MSSRFFIASLPLLWSCVTAVPAGPGYFPPNEKALPPVNGSDFSIKAFGLMETYDTSNWLSKFDVQAVSWCIAIWEHLAYDA